ncbi:MAG: hypothetical protein ABIN80_05730 [Dyadobacter sp.]|uniref:hypothetical protein n=1 Tax=Dyadobacter sp. TaxID=1914288 RepID=UPI0032668800
MTSDKFATSRAVPHTICWAAIPIIILVAFLFPQHTLDIQLHDTYYVIDNLHFTTAAALYLFVIGVVYWIIKKIEKRISYSLAFIHVVTTLTAVIALAVPIFGFTSRYVIIFGILAAFLIAQFIFVGNIIASFFRSR